jgi:WXXGXW repeat (2 copies)
MSKINKVSSFSIGLAVVSVALTLGTLGCQKNGTPDTSSQSQPAQTDQSQDPAAAANLAPAESTQTASANEQQPAPNQNYSNNNSDDNYDAGDEDASYGQPALQAPDPPPALPEYSQPDCPGDGYLWTPGYWSYSPQGYYWVPGAWARPPEVGLLWTPGYWGSSGGRYHYHYGFWGRHIGYYGGIGMEIASTITVPSTT